MNPPRSQSKIPHFNLDRHRAQAPTPADTPGGGENRIQISTFFTKVSAPGEPEQIIYNGDRIWARVTLTLLTAGPVAVGQSSQLGSASSGRGVLLPTGTPVVFNLAKANQLYVTAAAINSISVLIEPIPWLETLTGLLTAMAAGAPQPSQAVPALAGPPRSKI